MKTLLTPPRSRSFRSATFACVALALSLGASQLQAATGNELLTSFLPPAAVNKSVVDGTTLVAAVSEAVSTNKKQAPEIVAAAIPKARTKATRKSIVRAAIVALGDAKGTAPQVVYAAVKASPCVVGGETANPCECAEDYTKTAIEALGSEPSKKLVGDIVSAAIEALDGRCADPIVNAASSVSPQYADSIAEAGARASRGEGTAANGANGLADNGDGGDSGVFSPIGRPVPAPFVFPPATNGGGVAGPTTSPVN